MKLLDVKHMNNQESGTESRRGELALRNLWEDLGAEIQLFQSSNLDKEIVILLGWEFDTTYNFVEEKMPRNSDNK